MPTDAQVYAGSAAIGIAAGMRSMSAPALMSQFARRGTLSLGGSPVGFLNSTGAASTTAVLAIGELIADKLPFIPARTTTGPLLARAVSGGLSGAILSSAKKRSAWVGGLIGAFGAVGATFASYHLRRSVKETLHLPDAIVAVAEDAAVAAIGILIASRLREDAV